MGKQLSRLKMGQSYYAIITSTISAISLVSLAFNFNVWVILFTFPFLLLITYFIGYYLDVRNINSMDALKSNEMAHRFLNTGDLKNQEFQLLVASKTIESIVNAIKNGDDFKTEDLMDTYNEYRKKWSSPQE